MEWVRLRHGCYTPGVAVKSKIRIIAQLVFYTSSHFPWHSSRFRLHCFSSRDQYWNVMGLRHLIAICASLGSGRWKMEKAQMRTVDSAGFKNSTLWAGLKAFGVVILPA
jgi:hypothetical protein